MKKILISAILLIGLSDAAKAQDLPVAEMIVDTITFNIVSCSSSSATLMYSTNTAGNIAMPDRKFLAVQDLDSTNYVCVGSDPAMSCTSLSMQIPASQSLISLPLALFKSGGPYRAEVIKLYCKTSSTSGPSNIAIIQGK